MLLFSPQYISFLIYSVPFAQMRLVLTVHRLIYVLVVIYLFVLIVKAGSNAVNAEINFAVNANTITIATTTSA